MNPREIKKLSDDFPNQWNLVRIQLMESMRKSGKKTIPITGYTAEEKERRVALGHVQSIRHGG